jgi:hypothetical protein
MKIFSKKGLEMEMIVYFLIAAAVLALVVVGIMILNGKGSGALAHIKQIFSLGGR